MHDRAGLPSDVLHGGGQLHRVRPRGLDALLRLHDARRRDQLHGARDLLGRLDRADPPPDDAELGAHALRGRRWLGIGRGLVPSSSAEDMRSQPDVGLDLVGRCRRRRSAALGARHLGRSTRTSLRTPRWRPSAPPRSRSDRSPDSRMADRIVGVPRLEVVVERRDEPFRVLDRVVVEVATRHHVDRHDLALDGLRLVLRLLQDLDDPSAARRAAAATPCRAPSRTARTPPGRGTARGRDAAGRRPSSWP